MVDTNNNILGVITWDLENGNLKISWPNVNQAEYFHTTQHTSIISYYVFVSENPEDYQYMGSSCFLMKLEPKYTLYNLSKNSPDNRNIVLDSLLPNKK